MTTPHSAGTTFASNPFAAAGDRALDERFGSLKLRTALICAGMLLCAVAGWQLLRGPLAALVAEAWQLALGQRGLPLPHVLDDDAGLRGPMQQAVLGGVTALALIGHSYGKLGKLSLRWALVPPLLVTLVFTWVAPATRGMLPLVPGPLERDILHGRAAAAEKRLAEAEASTPLRQYVLAQVALRTREEALLRRDGEAVLQRADRVAYGVASGAELGEGLQLDPVIVLALDRALNGEPQTEVGLKRQAEGRAGMLRSGAVFAGRVVLGALLLVAAGVLLRVWNVMRRRVGTIAEQLAADAARADAQARRNEPFISRAAAARAQAAAAPVPPVRWGIIVRLVVLVATPVLLVKLLAVLLGAADAYRAAAPAASDQAIVLTGDSAHPCELVGAWTSSRGDSVFKITLTEDGRFTAEPIAAGPHGNASHRGRWEVLQGRRMRWIDDRRPGDASDVNPILETAAKSFTLREVSGQTSRFNRIGPVPGTRCR